MTHETEPSGLLVLGRGGQQPQDLGRLVRDREITTVMLAVPDMQGRLKGKLHDAHTFLGRFESHMCAYVLATDWDMNAQPGYRLTGWDNGFQDLRVVPDPKSIRRLSYLPGTVLVHGDAVHQGWPIDVAPRQMLRQQIAELASLGYRAKVGIESEFMLYKGTPAQARRRGYRGLTPVSPYNLDYALDHPPALAAFFDDLREALHAAGCPVEIKTEGAPGQIEVTWPYEDPMTACDIYTVHQHAVRHLAAQHKMAPTFMAAPQTGVGSGLHLHVSLWRDEEDSAFWMPQGSELPEPLQHSVAGLLDALRTWHCCTRPPRTRTSATDRTRSPPPASPGDTATAHAPSVSPARSRTRTWRTARRAPTRTPIWPWPPRSPGSSTASATSRSSPRPARATATRTPRRARCRTTWMRQPPTSPAAVSRRSHSGPTPWTTTSMPPSSNTPPSRSR
ncbi:hypothetical protein GCM10017557_19890 [Streptomyces aurantiacus]|uniref:GS catalytic domain-containing protein n=1 Tax=Streptomyces aurantiacus TaxID=47760 RepID=A0A7G1NZQ9_9ACTN|nr:hypothetical protein GCM10017557_19890 [Streptomyces aurantiacus]